jgi:hypothetical protein
MLHAAAALLLAAVTWYALGKRFCRCDSGGDAQGRAGLAFAVIFLTPAAFFAGVGLLLALLGFACPCRGSDPNVSARAALALAAARRPAAPGCACNGVCVCVKGQCRCTPAKACSQKCGCDLALRPRTLPAEDGGPGWTWDEARKGYYRTVETPRPTPAPPPPVFQGGIFAPPPAFFRPPPMTPLRGGMRCGGGG